MNDILKSARHKSIINASTYARDCSTLYHIQKQQDPRSNLQQDESVPLFKACYLYIGSGSNRVTSSTRYQQPLPSLVDWWYETCVGMGRNTEPLRKPIGLLNQVMAIRASVHDLDSLQDYLLPLLKQPTELPRIMAMFHDLTRHRIWNEMAVVTTRRESASLILGREAVAAVVSPRKRSIGDVDLPNRTALRKIKRGSDKLRFLLKQHADFQSLADGKKEKLNPASKRWYNRHVAQVVKCFLTCHKSSVASFLAGSSSGTGIFKTDPYKCNKGCQN